MGSQAICVTMVKTHRLTSAALSNKGTAHQVQRCFGAKGASRVQMDAASTCGAAQLWQIGNPSVEVGGERASETNRQSGVVQGVSAHKTALVVLL